MENITSNINTKSTENIESIKSNVFKVLQEFIKQEKLQNLNIEIENEYMILINYMDLKKDKTFNYHLIRNENNELYIYVEDTQQHIKEITAKKIEYDLEKNNIKSFFVEQDKTASFEKFKKDTKENVIAVDILKKFIDDYNNSCSVNSIILFGANQTGKTYLSSVIANNIIDTQIIQVSDLARFTTNSKFDSRVEILINRLKECNVLILDGLCEEVITIYFRDSILYPILKSRQTSKKPTIYTTHMTSLKDIINYYTTIDSNTDISVKLFNVINNSTKFVKLTNAVVEGV